MEMVWHKPYMFMHIHIKIHMNSYTQRETHIHTDKGT